MPNPRHARNDAARSYEGRRVLVCGDLAFLCQMVRILDRLDEMGVPAGLCESAVRALTDRVDYDAMRRTVTLENMKVIRQRSTGAVLVANFDKDGIPGYIGANTLAEMGVALLCRRPIFLVGELPSQLSDELSHWGLTELRGDLSSLAQQFASTCRQTTAQMPLLQF